MGGGPTPPTSPDGTLWVGERKSLSAAASGGRLVSARYRVTADHIYFDAGLISSSSEQVPMWAVRDVDVKQSMTQKARGVGDVVVRVQHDDYTGRPQVVLESIENPKTVRDLLNQHSDRARRAHQERNQTVRYTGAPPTMAGPAPSAGPQPDLADQLRRLAQLRDEGILSDAEFATQKARLLG